MGTFASLSAAPFEIWTSQAASLEPGSWEPGHKKTTKIDTKCMENQLKIIQNSIKNHSKIDPGGPWVLQDAPETLREAFGMLPGRSRDRLGSLQKHPGRSKIDQSRVQKRHENSITQIYNFSCDFVRILVAWTSENPSKNNGFLQVSPKRRFCQNCCFC